MAKQIIQWQASDGKVFGTEAEADKHDAKVWIQDLINKGYLNNELESDELVNLMVDYKNELIERLNILSKDSTLLAKDIPVGKSFIIVGKSTVYTRVSDLYIPMYRVAGQRNPEHLIAVVHKVDGETKECCISRNAVCKYVYAEK